MSNRLQTGPVPTKTGEITINLSERELRVIEEAIKMSCLDAQASLSTCIHRGMKDAKDPVGYVLNVADSLREKEALIDKIQLFRGFQTKTEPEGE